MHAMSNLDNAARSRFAGGRTYRCAKLESDDFGSDFTSTLMYTLAKS